MNRLVTLMSQPLYEICTTSGLSEFTHMPLSRSFDGLEQLLHGEGLVQECDAARCQRFPADSLGACSAHMYYRRFNAHGNELRRQIDPGFVAEMNINDKACCHPRDSGIQAFSGRCKQLRVISADRQCTLQGGPYVWSSSTMTMGFTPGT